jgi:uracil-DNA glycosylase family 4
MLLGDIDSVFTSSTNYFIDRQLRRIGASREQFTIANSFWCKAPYVGWAEGKGPEVGFAQAQCAPYLDDLIARMKPKAIVPMGNVALRRITGMTGIEKHNSYYIPTAYGIPAIPTFHPSFIQRGQQKLSGLWCYAVKRAIDVVQKDERPREYSLWLDPSLLEAERYFELGHDPLVCDIETPTPDKGEDDEDEREDASYTIVRISLSNRAGTAISLPWQPPYVDLVKRVLAQSREIIFWNQSFDLPRLQANGVNITSRVIDAMFAWHFLQSDLPKALGFVAPLFTCLEPWKHLSNGAPARYSALDSAITMDTYLGIKAQLEAEGRWQAFERHCVDTFPILIRMSEAGVMLDLDHQRKFRTRLELERDDALDKLQEMVPEEVKPVKHYKRKADVVLPFNPASPKQVKELIQYLGLPIPKGKGADKESTEAKHLKKLVKKNPIFRTILDYRERAKLIDAYMWSCKEDGRVHTTFAFHPSTWRKSSRDPNVQTVPKRNDLAHEFRRMVVASPGHALVESDSSAIEAVLVGFYAGSQRYIELAKSGVHKWLASEYAGRKVAKDDPLYDQIKRVVHLSNYMGTPNRILEEYPDTFASLKVARELQEFYFSTPAGKDVRKWQQQTLEQAHKERYLEIPWKYRHYFYDVFHYSNGQWVMGDDAKRAVAFRPQATASAIQTDFLLDIDRTDPVLRDSLRWIVHDSIICEVPEEDAADAARRLLKVMQQPHPLLGGLAIGAECKIGPNLAEMEVIQ